jgi:integrase
MRKAKPWYRKERDCWCVYINGRLIRLAKGRHNRKQAIRNWHRLMADDKTPPEEVTVRTLLERYEEAHVHHHQPRTVRNRRCSFESFKRQYGHERASNVKPHWVESWLDHHRSWSPTTVWTYTGWLQSAFRWAERQGMLPDNPLRAMTRPTPRSRGVECTISDEQHEVMLAEASPRLRDFLIALSETGARPGEVASVTAHDFDSTMGIWILRKHKTARMGKRRVVFLPTRIIEMCVRLAGEHPDGPLFRTEIGTKWTASGIHAALKRLTTRCGFTQRPIAYGYRHTFATDALAKGVPDAQVAELLGHASTTMLHRHYAHLCGRAKTLRTALESFR